MEVVGVVAALEVAGLEGSLGLEEGVAALEAGCVFDEFAGFALLNALELFALLDVASVVLETAELLSLLSFLPPVFFLPEWVQVDGILSALYQPFAVLGQPEVAIKPVEVQYFICCAYSLSLNSFFGKFS